MPPKTKKKAASPKKIEAKTEKPLKAEEHSETVPVSPVLNRLSQQFNLLSILIVALFLFQGYTFYRVKNLESNGVAAGPGQQQESPLSDKKLKEYAKDLKLDKKKFEACLDGGEKSELVSADAKQGADLGVQGTPGFFINGRFLGGAFPFETFKEIIDKELAGEATEACSDYSEELQQYCQDEQNQAYKPVAVDVAVGNSPSMGKDDAKVTIVEFSDFECPFCARAYGTVKQIKDAYPNDVKIVYKHLPLTNIHPNAEKAAEASECAQDQGKFWEMHDKMFEAQL